MTKSTSIQPSAETLVVGARVLLRNGKKATVTSVNGWGEYPVRTTAGIFTPNGCCLLSKRSSKDIVEVLQDDSKSLNKTTNK